MRVLLLLLAAASAHAQPLTVFPSPSGPQSPACTAHEDTRVCRTEREGAATVTIARGGREVARWDVASSVQAGPFAAFETDLDRDGDRDLLIATLTAVSNGLGVSYWTVDVLPDGTEAPTFSFQAEDFSPGGNSFGHDGDRLVLWATDWVQSDDPSGRRRPGMYVVGRPVALTSRGLVPLPSLPVRARRLLHSFDRDPEAGPVGWLSDRRAESRRVDPALSGCRQRHETLPIASVREAVTEWGTSYLVLDAGREITYRRGGFSPDQEDITHLGDAETRRLFPAEYQPSGLADTLTGRDLRLTTCTDGNWTKTRVLWL